MESVYGSMAGALIVAVLALVVLLGYALRKGAATTESVIRSNERLADKVLATSETQLDRMKLDNERDRFALSVERNDNTDRTVPTSQLDIRDSVPQPMSSYGGGG